MENYIPYIKLIILFLACLVTGVSTLSRKWYVNLPVFLACLVAETYLAYLFFPAYALWPAGGSLVIAGISCISPSGRKQNKRPIRLPVLSGVPYTHLEFYYYYSNFLVYGGAGSGKTKSIGKWLLEEYIKLGFAGFIYDFKDTDYTQTAYNLIEKHGYPHKFYYVSFDKPERSYRFNPLKVVKDRTELMQLMEDVLLALLPKGEKQNEWIAGGLGILRGVAFRFWDEFPEYCTLPHIMAFIMTASTRQLSMFLQQNLISEMMAGAYLKAEGSEKTQASYLSTLCNNLSAISQNEEIAYILSGDDFDFNLIDPEDPKLFAISNNFSKNSVYAPVIGMLMSISTRQFTMQNKVPFVYFLDEMTTVNIKNFETLPSVLREYLAAFVLLTQSGAKLESLYGKLDRSSVEANFGIQFFGRTKDVEALKYYPQMFGKEEKERKSRSTGKSGSSTNRSVTVSSQKEDVYQGRDFADLEPGEFIGSATRANVGYFKVNFQEFKEKGEKPLPNVRVLEPEEITRNFARILAEVRSLFPCE
ncbi:type IV secretion system DNA-binding domain-containing protein [Bacteroides fragilis]|uniref:pathogenicity island mobilization protein BfmC n=1 Tax=Bacteroides fragilis TaxID=817 RepID=UPI00202E52B0|nr:pathogenicity island mobilization protein BfmC [Bacteroides fragilis]MCM0298282.1 type IV secretion system DNA-binding domain-containing protein [Bacteroides fragilis]